MRILIATNHSYMFYQVRRTLVETLLKKHEVVLSTPFVGREETLRAMGLRCVETSLDRRSIDMPSEVALLRTYRALLREVKPELVITYSIKPNLYLGWCCRWAGIPYAANVQGLGSAFERPLLAAAVAAMYRAALRRAGVVFFENEANAQLFLSHRLLRAEQVCVLPGAGVDLCEYPVVPLRRDGICRFLFVGRMMKEKGVDELFAAAQQLKSELGEAVAFDVVGFYEDAYKNAVEQLTADGVIAFHGFQTDVRPFYAAADCVVLPSYHEGMSNVLLEGAATGRALITSNIPGCREAVLPGVSGLLCPARDAAALTRAMRTFAKLSCEEWWKMGLAGRKLMEQRFDKRVAVDKTLRALGLHGESEAFDGC